MELDARRTIRSSRFDGRIAYRNAREYVMAYFIPCSHSNHSGDLSLRRKVWMIGTVTDVSLDSDEVGTSDEEETTDDDYTEEFLCGYCWYPLTKEWVMQHVFPEEFDPDLDRP